MSKLKELDRSACVAWSRVASNPRLLATATAAGSLDRDFSTSAQLELFSLNESLPNVLAPQGRIDLPDRVNRLEWGIVDEKTYPSGVLACAHTEGTIGLYNAAKVKGASGAEGGALLHSAKKHNGPVISLDFNTLQPNLLASAGQDSEIFIWDLSKVLPILIFEFEFNTLTHFLFASPAIDYPCFRDWFRIDAIFNLHLKSMVLFPLLVREFIATLICKSMDYRVFEQGYVF